MIDVIKRACAVLDCDPVQVMTYHIDEEAEQVIMVIDRGIAGCPKLTIPFSELPAPAPPKEEKPKRATRKRTTRKKSD